MAAHDPAEEFAGLFRARFGRPLLPAARPAVAWELTANFARTSTYFASANLDEVRDLAAAGTRYLASDTTGVVCFPSCRNARRITPAHRHRFASLASAGRAGFRPCLHCSPVLHDSPLRKQSA